MIRNAPGRVSKMVAIACLPRFGRPGHRRRVVGAVGRVSSRTPTTGGRGGSGGITVPPEPQHSSGRAAGAVPQAVIDVPFAITVVTLSRMSTTASTSVNVS